MRFKNMILLMVLLTSACAPESQDVVPSATGGAGVGGSSGAGGVGGSGAGAGNGGSAGSSGTSGAGGAGGLGGDGGAGTGGMAGTAGVAGAGGSGGAGSGGVGGAGSGGVGGAGTGGIGGAGAGGLGGSGGSGGDPDEGTFAQMITLKDLELNQGVAIPIAKDGVHVDQAARDARLIKDRAGLFRAVWQTQAGFTPRNIEGRLTLKYPSGAQETLRETKMISGNADLGTLDGTFNWKLGPLQTQTGVQYSVGLFEAAPTGDPVPSPKPRIPQDGMTDMQIPSAPMVMEITFVPIEMGGETADLSAANVEFNREGYVNMDPVSEVKMTLHAPISVSGSDIGAVLDAVSNLRASENAAPQMYYIGLAPLSVTGWSGVSNLPSADKNGDRSSASPVSNTPGDFPGDLTWEFTVHETGHAQGREHSPGCGAGGPDPEWPFPDDFIHVQGYDITRHELRSATEFHDIMGYCTPDWTSAWTWEHFAIRTEILSSWGPEPAPMPSTYVLRGLVPIGSGDMHWSAMRGTFDANKPGTPIQVSIALSSGDVIDVEGIEQHLHDAPFINIEVPLPAPPSDLAGIQADVRGTLVPVPVAGLTDKFDRFYAQYGARQ